MKIVDTFLFSEEHEKELLLLKFILSDKYIDEWVICENAYSHQGDYTGLVARKLIETDNRFAPYRAKITIIEREKQFEVVDKTKVQDDIAFKCENWQRNLAYDYFIEKYNDEDWLVLNDVDEMIDFTDEGRVKEFFEHLAIAAGEGMLRLPRLRYWYDFDNQFTLPRASVMCTKAYLLAHTQLTLALIRKHYSGGSAQGWKNNIIFEYSSCFDVAHIVRKLDTNPHTGISKQVLLQALRCNHLTIPQQVGHRKQLKPTPAFFLKTVELTGHNSPLYVRQHLLQLKTNVVDKNYEANRRKDYPQFYTPYFKYVDAFKTSARKQKKFFSKKFQFLLRRVGLAKTVTTSQAEQKW